MGFSWACMAFESPSGMVQSFASTPADFEENRFFLRVTPPEYLIGPRTKIFNPEYGFFQITGEQSSKYMKLLT